MQSVLLSCGSIIVEPPPTVALKSLDALALVVELQFRVASPTQRTEARIEVLDLVCRHCKSAGLLLAMPPESAVVMTEPPTEETARPPRVEPIEFIDAIAIFATLTRNEKQSLAQATSARAFRKGEVIARQGDILPTLTMIRAGVIVMRCDGREIGRLAPGDFFGETGLLAGMGEACTLGALTRVIAYEIDQQAFAPLLLNRPAMTEDLALSLSRSTLQARATEPQGLRHERRAHVFRKAIEFRKAQRGGLHRRSAGGGGHGASGNAALHQADRDAGPDPSRAGTSGADVGCAASDRREQIRRRPDWRDRQRLRWFEPRRAMGFTVGNDPVMRDRAGGPA
jgi:CRP-like cAMP-binding protein